MFHCVCVCLCLLCIAIAFVLRIWFYSFFIRAVFSAVFSLTVLPGLLFTHWFFLVLLSMANKDSFIHSFIQCESLCPVSPTSLEICMCGFRFTKFTKFLGEVKMVPPLRYPKTKKLSDPPTRGSAHGPRWGLRPPDSRAFSSSKFATTPLVTGPSVLRGNWRYEQMPVPNSPFCFQYAVLL